MINNTIFWKLRLRQLIICIKKITITLKLSKVGSGSVRLDFETILKGLSSMGQRDGAVCRVLVGSCPAPHSGLWRWSCCHSVVG